MGKLTLRETYNMIRFQYIRHNSHVDTYKGQNLLWRTATMVAVKNTVELWKGQWA